MSRNILYLIVIIFFGCSSSKTISNEEKGYIVGTFTIIDEKPRFDAYSLHYKPKGKKIGWFSSYHKIIVQARLGFFKSKLVSDFSIGNKKVFIFLKEHSAREYEFFNYDLFTNLGLIQSHLQSKKEFSIPFKVTKDSINYIGNITFYPNGNENGNLFVLKDDFSQDILKIKEKYPDMNWETLQNKTIKEGDLENAFFELK
ncbi:MAG TPA: hypothetical protein VFM65_10410 [Flavobacteriaceae bacterium]|nr:hypothetical protein [Flavobacteriaceae bacterium]